MTLKTFSRQNPTVTLKVPDPLTVEAWMKWWSVYNENFGKGENGAWLPARYLAGLSICKMATYTTDDGVEHDMLEEPSAVPAAIARWVGSTLDEYVADSSRLPKESAEEPPEPPSA